ncbi:flavin reductase [Oscillospiraceae bacterium PP1C4]
MDLQAFFKMSYGLYVVNSAFDGKQNGCIVNTVTQVTAEPPKVAVAISKNSLTAELIEKSGVFNAVPLTQSATMLMIGRFGFREGRVFEKYEGIPFSVDVNGVNYPTEAVGALFCCKVLSKLDLGTHVLFVGEAVEAKSLSSDPVMTYEYYHKVIKGSTPVNAPSYKKPEKKSGWRCKICGFVHEGDQLPPDFICPVCKKDASFFEKI